MTRTLAMAGFDPACGFLHADADGRYSLSYDVLELLRADIDAAILPWVASQTWKRADFPVTPEADGAAGCGGGATDGRHTIADET